MGWGVVHRLPREVIRVSWFLSVPCQAGDPCTALQLSQDEADEPRILRRKDKEMLNGRNALPWICV